MRFVIFTHSLVSDWNHGNAHFLRGVATELVHRRHQVDVFEPASGWSRQNLIRFHGPETVNKFHEAYPAISSSLYHEETLDLNQVLDGADVVIVHEWNPPSIVRRIGEHHRQNRSYRLFFHDTHHRSATQPDEMSRYELTHYDGVLAYGSVIRDLYLTNAWSRYAWTWHEAADTRVFRPLSNAKKEGDVVWIGNWGDDERAEELKEFLIEPVRRLGLKARIYGVRYPEHALAALCAAGIEYGGWLPNYRVPEVLARYRVTVHVPRRPYSRALPGIPTIRPFEAMACGIPMISAPWRDTENLFRPGHDFLYANSGREMEQSLSTLMASAEKRASLAKSGLETIRSRHTCSHRADQLLEIVSGVPQ